MGLFQSSMVPFSYLGTNFWQEISAPKEEMAAKKVEIKTQEKIPIYEKVNKNIYNLLVQHVNYNL